MLQMSFRMPVLAVVLLLFSNTAQAETIRVAVASNALEAVKYLARQFDDKTGNQVQLSSGSTGKLYAQIVNGAPFDLFLAANSREPKRLEQAGLGVKGSRRTYALGRLALLSSETPLDNKAGVKTQLKRFSELGPSHFAIANPETAPYGLAARQALQHFGLWTSLQSKMIKGENINQAFQYVTSGNAQYGLVALSQIKKFAIPAARYAVLPPDSYARIEQQAVLLTRAANKPAVRALLEYLTGTTAGTVLSEKFGYGTPTLAMQPKVD